MKRYAKIFGTGLALVVTAAPLASADIAISRRDCEYLTRYQPAPDVAYQPGVDVHGRPVAPADIGGGSQLKLPETIYIPIEVNIGRRYHIPANSPLWKATAEIGTVAVTGDQVTFNGQPLTSDDDAALAAMCRDKFGR
ncbi:MAG TPA: hypothetical protein VM639_02635 [Dongiaceae bacterium]|nr:hypothetical protein [Dongiaceae bacterium]